MKLGYFSSYDRGLVYLLKEWANLQKAIPNLTLEICYGWNLYDKARTSPDDIAWKNMMVSLMKQPGITEHGRVSKERLDEITAQCDIWAYPTNWWETNCITALNGQKLGVVPVTFAYAGLRDTVYSGISLPYEGAEQEGALPAFFDALIKLANDPETLNKYKEDAKKGAKDFAWEKIANDWEQLFKYER